MEIDFIVREHESDVLMLADRATERMTAPCVLGCDGVAPARRTYQRMQWVNRAGPRRTWAFRKPWPISPRTRSRPTRIRSNETSARPPCEFVSIVSNIRSTRTRGASRSAKASLFRDLCRVPVITMLIAASGTPVIMYFRPSHSMTMNGTPSCASSADAQGFVQGAQKRGLPVNVGISAAGHPGGGHFQHVCARRRAT